MVKSIRWRLQLWYAGILLAGLSGFASFLYLQRRSSLFGDVDQRLEAAVFYLDASLRRFPQREFDGIFPGKEGKDGKPPPFPPPDPDPKKGPPDFEKKPFDGEGKKGPKGFPQPLNREKLLAELDMPPLVRFAAGPGSPPPYFAIWRTNGDVLKSSLPADISATPLEGLPESPRFLQSQGRREVRLAGPFRSQILVGQSIAREQADLRAFAWQLLGAGGVVLAIGFAGGWMISGRLVRPIAAISQTAEQISAKQLSQRIDLEPLDRELVDLAQVLNAMFARLEGEFERQARFAADASHELRTPLAVIHSNVELALSRPRSLSEYQETLRTCLKASVRMRALVEGLMILARADSSRLGLQKLKIDLRTVVEESVAPFAGPLHEAGVSLTTTLPATPLTMMGDRLLLGRVVTNLLGNALRHTPKGGSIRIGLASDGNEAVFTIADTGEGIDPDYHQRIFERFFRVDPARRSNTGGSGLGLAIAKSLIDAHGGTLAVRSKPGQGSTFEIRLPRE